ncbi:MAG: undecaprenyl-diphosphate phosphatase [Pseudomonadota bacterium]
MDWLQVIILAIVQGITEFLPISSSAHLILPAQLSDWPDQGLAFDVAVHFGTLGAVLLYFARDLGRFTGGGLRVLTEQRWNEDADLALKIVVATVPAVIGGLLLKDWIETEARTIVVIATTTVVFGALLWVADRRPGSTDTPSWPVAVGIGLFQALALVPGTSRSGITMTAALLLGLSRTGAARFSFLLAIPTIAGGALLLLLDVLENGTELGTAKLLTGTALAFVTAYLAIHYFIALVERTGMLPYVLYRLALGAFLYGLLLLRA